MKIILQNLAVEYIAKAARRIYFRKIKKEPDALVQVRRAGDSNWMDAEQGTGFIFDRVNTGWEIHSEGGSAELDIEFLESDVEFLDNRSNIESTPIPSVARNAYLSDNAASNPDYQLNPEATNQVNLSALSRFAGMKNIRFIELQNRSAAAKDILIGKLSESNVLAFRSIEPGEKIKLEFFGWLNIKTLSGTGVQIFVITAYGEE